jgi:hypothetical protein
MHTGIQINDLRKLCGDGKIKWTTHVIMRLQERGINPADVKHCINGGEIIEEYVDGSPHPGCLVLGKTLDGKPLHCVVGVGDGYVWFVTSYYPNNIKWERDNKTRKGLK